MKLFSTGILGINARNLLYIRPFNKKRATNLADHKLQSKIFFKNHQIPTAPIYRVIHNKNELEHFRFEDIAAKSFVIKPNRGFGGQGIKIITQKDSLSEEKKQELKAHIANILDGNFSLTNAPDIALLEQRIICHPELAAFSYKGLPDIRVIVHNLIPIMAMLRLPTKESDGKANYHAGGAIAGIDLSTGKITYAVIHGKYVQTLPGQVQSIIGFTIPNWEQVLTIASKAQLYSNIGYLAIDIVLNKKGDPLVLEMNARGGLSIQIANKAKLRERLDRIQGLRIKDPAKGVRIGKELFGSHKTSDTLESEIEELSGKEILGAYETIELIGKNNHRERTLALVDTSKIYTSIDRRLAQKLGLISENYEIDNTSFFRVSLTLGKKKRRTFVTIKDYSNQSYQVIVGRRNLRDTLIDPFRGLPSRYLQAPYQISATLEQEKEADQLISEIYEKFNFLHYLNPVNVTEELQKWTENQEYMPQLAYRPLPESYRSMRSELHTIPEFESDIGQLISGRAKEIITQIDLLNAVGSDTYLETSKELFRPLRPEESATVQEIVAQPPQPINKKDIALLKADEIQQAFTKAIAQLELQGWKAKIDNTTSSAIRVKNNYTIGIPENKKVAPHRLQQLIAHELMAHALTRDNGEKQQWRIFSYGFPQYIYTQEGLAVLHETWATPELKENILYRTARDAFLVQEANRLNGKELMLLLLSLFKPNTAWQNFIKLKRGMINTNNIGSWGRETAYFIGFNQLRSLAKIDPIFYSGRIHEPNIVVAQKYNTVANIKLPHFPLFLSL